MLDAVAYVGCIFNIETPLFLPINEMPVSTNAMGIENLQAAL